MTPETEHEPWRPLPCGALIMGVGPAACYLPAGHNFGHAYATTRRTITVPPEPHDDPQQA